MTKTATPQVIVLKNLIRYDDGKRSEVAVSIASSKPFNSKNAKGATAAVSRLDEVKQMAKIEAASVSSLLSQLARSV